MCGQRCGDVPFTIVFSNRRAEGVSMRGVADLLLCSYSVSNSRRTLANGNTTG